MGEPGRPSHLARADALIAHLERASDRLDAAEAQIAAADGDLRALARAHEECATLLDRYADSAFGDGDFRAYLEFQDELATFVDGLDEDLPERAAFEEIDDRLHQRRLTDADLAAARERLAGVADRTAVLDERRRAADRIGRRRRAIDREIDRLGDRIDDCEAILAYADADLSADDAALARTIADYNRRVAADFAAFLESASAREALEWLDRTRWYPLVEYRPPPEALRAFVDASPPGTEPLGTLRAYAEYSRSKLDHYVDDPDALKRSVGPHQGYLRRLEASPLQIAWPPPPATALRYRTRALFGVVGRIADEETLAALQGVREAAFDERYPARRAAAVARAALDPVDRRRLRWGLIARERAAARQARDRLRAALAAAPDP